MPIDNSSPEKIISWNFPPVPLVSAISIAICAASIVALVIAPAPEPTMAQGARDLAHLVALRDEHRAVRGWSPIQRLKEVDELDIAYAESLSRGGMDREGGNAQ